MKLSSLFKWLIFIIIIIIIIGGTVIIIIIRGPGPTPPICPVCGLNAIKLLGIAEVVLGLVSIGIVSRIRSAQKFN